MATQTVHVQGWPPILECPPKSGVGLFPGFGDMFQEVLWVFRAPFPDSSDVQLTHTAPLDGSKSQERKTPDQD